MAFALGVRLAFLALVGDTYDYDEFVALLLGRDWAHGAVPYRDFMFFHPPGVLLLTRVMEPLFYAWWPLARVFMASIDTITALLVACLGRELWGRRAGLIAGVAYALSPVALIASVRVGEDPLITFFGVMSVFLVLRRAPGWSLAAGVALAIAVWVKYPAVYFVPILVLAAPRRAPLVLAGAAGTLAALMAPFYVDWHAFYEQTVVFQRSRWLMDSGVRLWTTVIFWLGANALAAIALFIAAGHRLAFWSSERHVHVDRGALPLWTVAGFALGLLFGLNSQVYYHYFVVVVPFASLLAAWLLSEIGRRLGRALLVLGVALAGVWGLALDNGGPSPLFVTAAHLSAIRPTIGLLESMHPASGKILADRFEYAYLADRPAVDQYFWNVGVLVDARELERLLSGTSAVVLSYGASSGFPSGFVRFLNAHLHAMQTPTNTVWTCLCNRAASAQK